MRFGLTGIKKCFLGRRQLAYVKDLAQFQKFAQIAAGRIGQLLNLESLSADVGVSANTIKEWISLLEASFIIIRLRSYHENFGKRAIKSPKLYFTDVGLACYLLGIENTTQLARDPLRGNLFENLVLLELMKHRLNQSLPPKSAIPQDFSSTTDPMSKPLPHFPFSAIPNAAQALHPKIRPPVTSMRGVRLNNEIKIQ